MSARDILEITNLLNLYAVAIDSLRLDLFDLVFTPDAAVIYPTSSWSDRESFKRDFAASHARLSATQHSVCNHVVLLNGDAANAMSYVIARLVGHIPAGDAAYWQIGGWYDDRLIRTETGWRIRARACRTNWSEGNPQICATGPGQIIDPPMQLLRDLARDGEVDFLKSVAGRASLS